ncbi:MAG: hypothetical protein HC780_00460 [Leptolyngbyaceae cyanobacterium CSU_1_3]|nr:hypothetical protein [Leptolyngbyaceae cyanobacterium CSU_1_3]
MSLWDEILGKASLKQGNLPGDGDRRSPSPHRVAPANTRSVLATPAPLAHCHTALGSQTPPRQPWKRGSPEMRSTPPSLPAYDRSDGNNLHHNWFNRRNLGQMGDRLQGRLATQRFVPLRCLLYFYQAAIVHLLILIPRRATILSQPTTID